MSQRAPTVSESIACVLSSEFKDIYDRMLETLFKNNIMKMYIFFKEDRITGKTSAGRHFQYLMQLWKPSADPSQTHDCCACALVMWPLNATRVH